MIDSFLQVDDPFGTFLRTVSVELTGLSIGTALLVQPRYAVFVDGQVTYDDDSHLVTTETDGAIALDVCYVRTLWGPERLGHVLSRTGTDIADWEPYYGEIIREENRARRLRDISGLYITELASL